MESENEFLSGYYIVAYQDVDFYIRFLNNSNDLLENESIASSHYDTYEEAEKVLDSILIYSDTIDSENTRNAQVCNLSPPGTFCQ